MTTHKEVFLKYGFRPPEFFLIPSQQDIDKRIELLKKIADTTSIKEPYENQYLVVYSLLFPLEIERRLKLIDSDRFFDAFGLNVDLSRVHPELLYKICFSLVSNDNGTNCHFKMNVLYPLRSLNDQEWDKYLSYFSPEYPLLNLFSSDTQDKERSRLINHLLSFNKQLKQIDASCFLADIYDYIRTEQTRKTPTA